MAQNDAVLEGLLTIFHTERSSDTECLENVQVGWAVGESPDRVPLRSVDLTGPSWP